VAARLLECAAGDVRIEDGRAFVVGAPARALSLGQLARAALRDKTLGDLGGPGLWATKFYAPSTVTWASGVHAAVVEVDEETGQLRILRYVIVHDCGRQLHPVIVAGQVAGGFAQGLGVALGEELVYGADGQLLTATLMDYPLLRAEDMPPLVTDHIEAATAHNPLGVRGVGEGATCPPAAVIANALSDAFGGRLRIRTPVLTPARVHAMLREAGVQCPSRAVVSSNRVLATGPGESTAGDPAERRRQSAGDPRSQ
jgi:carbon-monoxide dehydrogenase large subunit